MAYTQLSRTTPVIEAWQDITDEQNDAQTAAIYDVIGKHGGNVLTVGFSPTQANLVSVIEYPRRVVGPEKRGRHPRPPHSRVPVDRAALGRGRLGLSGPRGQPGPLSAGRRLGELGSGSRLAHPLLSGQPERDR